MQQVQPHTREETVLAEKGVQLWEMESAYTQNSIQTERGQPNQCLAGYSPWGRKESDTTE